MTASLILKFDECLCQGFGGYCFYNSNFPNESRNHAGCFIYKCLQIADVERWDDLKNKAIRVKISEDRIVAIGHIIKDIWFEPALEFKNLND